MTDPQVEPTANDRVFVFLGKVNMAVKVTYVDKQEQTFPSGVRCERDTQSSPEQWDIFDPQNKRLASVNATIVQSIKVEEYGQNDTSALMGGGGDAR